METLKNFVLFIVKSAVIVGLASTAASFILGINEAKDHFVGTLAFLTPYAAATGLVAGAIGFCIMWALRKLPPMKFTIASYFVATALGAVAIVFWRQGFHTTTWKLLFLPVLPFVISVFLFTKISQKHIQA